MFKINRADLFRPLVSQFQAVDDGSNAPFLLENSISPVVDLTRPSKIPTYDWRWSVQTGTGTLAAARPGYRFVIVYMDISVVNAVTTGTGTLAGITVTINGSAGQIMYILTESAIAANAHKVVSCELICDENTDVNSLVAGTHTAVRIGAAGYYIRA
jgi:hypothetical protein